VNNLQKKYIAIITLSLMSMGGCQMPAGEGGGGAGAFTSFLPLILIFVLFYFPHTAAAAETGTEKD
jgi:hypothetical protein